MAKNQQNIIKLLEDYKTLVKPIAQKEFIELQEFANKNGLNETLKPWDISYYAEKFKENKFGFDSEQLRPYFKFENVREGAFTVASKLYDISFKKANDYPLYHEDVETFDVIDNKTNDIVGVLYTDYFPRKTKQGGAWMNDYVKQSLFNNGKRKPPVIGNHGNFTKPIANKPSLLSFDEVLTFFHEFGHGLHGLLSDTRYKSQAGTSVKWDFVELPSQIMENWAKEPEVLALFAKHYQTGEIMPTELINKNKDAENFRAASFFLRQIMLAWLDLKWHNTNPFEINDVMEFEYNNCKDFYLTNPEGGAISPSFSHIFDGGYSAGYYSYKWAEILDADAFEAFKEKGLFNREIAEKFKKLLAKGGSDSPEKIYFEFRGKNPDPSALLRRKGLAA
jgi:peptidyl-dipeptidase Dcp